MKKIVLLKKTVITLFFIICLLPLLTFMRDFFNFSSLNIIFKERTFLILKNSLFQAFLSTFVAFIISLLPAYYISRSNNIFSKLLKNTIFIPFFYPSISAVVSFSVIFLFIKKKFGINISYSLLAVIIGHSFYNSPIFVKYIGDALKRVDDSFVEEAKILGASNFIIFFKIELPMIIHSIFKGFIIVFIYSFTSFAIVLSLGTLKYSTFEVAIAQTLMNELDFSKALVYSLLQMGILLFLNSVLYRKSIYNSGNENRKNVKLNLNIVSFSIFYLIFEYGVVFVGILAGFFNFQKSKFDFTAFFIIFSEKFNNKYPVAKSIGNSLLLAFLVATIVIIISYFLLRWGEKSTEIFILSTLGISSVFIAMCLYYLHLIYSIPLILLLMIGFIQVSIPISYSFLHKYIKGFDKTIIEAAKIDGANSFEIFRKIEFPILKPIFLTVFLQIFAIIYGEFTIAYSMQISTHFPVVSVVNYSMLGRKLMMESAAFSGVNVLIVYTIYGLSQIIVKDKN